MICKPVIKDIDALEVLDSRGNPTVMAKVTVEKGTDIYTGTAIVPSGASTGKYEAWELRDTDSDRYGGKGTLIAVKHVKEEIRGKLTGLNAFDQRNIDNHMLALDGTDNKSNLGANAILSVSLACARAAANAASLPLYRYLGGAQVSTLPVPMMNILNGGAHASNNIDLQEFMIMPIGAHSFAVALKQCSEVYKTLGKILKSRNLATGVGDEGGYAPNLRTADEAIKLIMEAIEESGYTLGYDGDFMIALDAASSEWYTPEGGYLQPKSQKAMTPKNLITYWKGLITKYPIISIEDGLGEDDWDSWTDMTAAIGHRVQLVGDDLFVTNREKIERGIRSKAGNSVLIKLNQIGTLSETMDAVTAAQKHGYTAIISHRSGDSEDSFIADLAVALGAGQIKSGAPARSERVAKYNRLLEIEAENEGNMLYAGRNAFHNLDM